MTSRLSTALVHLEDAVDSEGVHHIWCCGETTMCGMPVDMWEDCDQPCRHSDCVVCAELDAQPCGRCGAA